MDFSGWEKLSLVDFDHRLTTTLFVAGCPFRCPFCHNGELVLHPAIAPKIPWSQILDYLKKRQGILEAVCISGGEPTLLPDLEDKLRQIKALGYVIKLDSNGWKPNLLEKLIQEKLVDYVAMDIKNSPEDYPKTAGTSIDLLSIDRSIKLLQNSGIGYEFRTTIMEEFHDEEAIKAIGQWIHGAKRYYLQKYEDRAGCLEHGFHPISKEKAEKFASLLRNDVEEVSLRGYE